MVETRHQMAANEENHRALEALEDGEVPPNVLEHQIAGPSVSALEQLNSSAAQLGFTADDIAVFLKMRLPSEHMPLETKTPSATPPPVLDPSLAKMTENNVYDLRLLHKDRFTSSSQSNKDRFDRLDRVLENNGLYTMARKIRLCPIYSEENPTGQTKEEISLNGDIVTIIKADNFTLWAHDMRRLNHILDQSFALEVRHHTNGFLTKNGIQAYTDLHDFYFSQTNNGAKETRNAFDNFRIKPTSQSIRQDIVKFEELRSQWEYAVDLVFNDKMNNGYLDEKFDADPRPGVVASLTATNLTKWTYLQRLNSLHDLHNCDTVPTKVVQIKAMSTSKTSPVPKQPCHNFAKGNCHRGDTCKYEHASSSNKTSNSKPTAPGPPRIAYSQSQGPTKQVVHSFISPRHRQTVGPSVPRGDPNNPLGLSRNQKVKLNALIADEEMDSWVDQSHYHHVSRDSNGNTFAGVFTTDQPSSSSSSSSSASIADDPNLQTPVFSRYTDVFRTFEYRSEMTEAEYNLYRLTPARQPIAPEPVSALPAPASDSDSEHDTMHSTSSSDSDDSLEWILRENKNVHRADTDTYPPSIMLYVDLVVHRFHLAGTHPEYDSATSLSNYLIYTSFHNTPAAGYERTDLQILGWSVSYPLQTYTVIPDFRTGTPALLDLIQNIGRSYLRAIYTPIPFLSPITEDSYMTFSPLRTVYNAPSTPGSYVSTVACVADYLYYFDHLNTVAGNTRQYLLLAIIYDFMAFSAQKYRRILGSRPPSVKQLVAARTALRNTIQQVRGTSRNSTEYDHLIRIMLCIAATIMPIPYICPPADPLGYASPPSKAKRLRQDPPSAQITKLDIPDSTFKRPRLIPVRSALPVVVATRPIPTPQEPLNITSPQHSPPTVHTLHSPSLNDGENSDTSDSINYFATVSLNAMSAEASTKYIMDSGAGKSGTSDLSLLKNAIPCQGITVTGAFGPSTAPTHTGSLGPLNLDAVYIEGMGAQTLVSLSQFCAGGTSGTKYIGVFTPTEYRMYEMKSALSSLSTLAKTGKEAERGKVQNGIYVRESS